MKNKFIIILFLLGLIVFKITAQNVIANRSASKIQSSTIVFRNIKPSGAGLRPVSAKLLVH